MFKELRNKFLILNLVIISVTMLMAFTAIYLMTYNNVNRDINGELRKISEFNRKPMETPKDLPHPPERSLSFTINTDNNGNVESFNSIFEIEKDFYEKAKTLALNKNKENGRFKLEDNYWAFMIRPSFYGNKITFLDITSRQGILTNLIYTFFIVALAMLIVIFLISRFFANKSIKPIKEAFERQKQFIADASHELKTPLAVINTNVDVLLGSGEDTIKNQSKWLYYIKSEVERMTNLTKDLLYLTNVDYSEVSLIFSSFNLSEALENVILTMEGVIFESNILLDYHMDSNLIMMGNNEQIRQVIMILLDNALKYTEPKGKVEVVLRRNHNHSLLSIKNSGKGIAEEDINKIFDRFYRIDKSRSRNSGGYGLGLAIARAIVEQHGGSIYAKSVLNESTTFTVELPLIN